MGDDHIFLSFLGMKTAQSNFYNDFDKNSQEAPGWAILVRRTTGRDVGFAGLSEFPVERT
jgi:hypothetical protein